MKTRLFIKQITKAVSVCRSGFVLLSLAMLFISINSVAQNPKQQIHHKDSLRADFEDLKKVLYESHENPFYYIDSITFEQAYDSLYKRINNDMSLAEFSQKTGQLLQRLRDSHSTVNLRSLFNFTRGDTSLNLYFQTALYDGKIVVRKDYLDMLPTGAELLEINGIPVKNLEQETKPYYFYEGASSRQAPLIFSSLIPKVYAMNYGVQLSNTIVTVTGTDTTKTVYPGTPYKVIRKDKKSDSSGPFNLEIINGTAFLKIQSFAALSERKYASFLHKSFKKIKRKNCDSLVIDLRNNPGGNVWRMESLFTYLNGKDVLSPKETVAIKSELSSIKYTKLTKGIGGWVRMKWYRNNDKMRVFREMASSPLHKRDTFTYKVLTPKKRIAFKGHQTLFTNHRSGSASVLFASEFRSNAYGPIMGTPCLGPLGGTWGNPTPYRMKRSGLLVYLSVLRLNTSVSPELARKNILPDVYYEKTIEDLKANKDGLRELYFRSF